MTQVNITPTGENGSEPEGLLSLFEARTKIYPAKVSGTFRQLKWAFMLVLLGIYYGSPWLRWERGLGAPDQAILVDITNRKFYFFFIEIWPQEVYYFTGVLLLAALGLFFATTLLGRVWCGYACPQTVWTDLFLAVERAIEGDKVKRQRLDAAPWNLEKISKRLTKHLSWLFIGLCTGGAWVFYFNDAPSLMNGILHGTLDFTQAFWIGFLTFSTYLMAGFAREQVCTFMCPYARFQGAMFDEDSLIVSYDETRGEPRGNTKDATEHGDCVNCLRCVAVCPTGIDIRNGQQYQCINCGLCIDACNTIMDKLGRARGLIRYNTFHNAVPDTARWWQLGKHVRFIRPRTLFYVVIMSTVSCVMVYALLTRPLMDINVLRARNPLFIQLADGGIRNAYTVNLVNKTWATQTYTLTTSEDEAVLRIPEISVPQQNLATAQVKPGKVGQFRLLVDMPYTGQGGSKPLSIKAKTAEFGDTYLSTFVMPEED